MPDDRIYDAINLFHKYFHKCSTTGMGNANCGGDQAYQAKYQRVAQVALAKLWRLWSQDEIAFTHLHPRRIGESSDDPTRPDIRVNKRIEPPTTPTPYQGAPGQGKLAATSCNLVHEAVHLAFNVRAYPEEELLCRTIETLYFRYLLHPRMYQSQFTGTRCTAMYLASTPYYGDYDRQLKWWRGRDLVDVVFMIREYRELEVDETAAFIARSLSWWGGPSCRWASTRGYYLRSLASRNRDYAPQILDILESLAQRQSLSQWDTAKTCAGDLDRIRRGLTRANHMNNPAFAARVRRVQGRLVELRSPTPLPWGTVRDS